MARYVDDILIISNWFCPKCVEKLAPRIYRGVMGFDTCNDGEAFINGFNVVKFLDLWIYAGWTSTNIFLVNK